MSNLQRLVSNKNFENGLIIDNFYYFDLWVWTVIWTKANTVKILSIRTVTFFCSSDPIHNTIMNATLKCQVSPLIWVGQHWKYCVEDITLLTHISQISRVQMLWDPWLLYGYWAAACCFKVSSCTKKDHTWLRDKWELLLRLGWHYLLIWGVKKWPRKCR